jgi:rhodanese-related sulfurtransferase
MSAKSISAAELARLAKESGGVELIDVRTPAEFGEVHVTFAKNVPLDRLEAKSFMQNRNGHADKPLYVICRSGSRSNMACEKFLSAGYANVVSIEGGTQACVAAGLPVVQGKKVMSLERQVRVVAGAIVFAGTVLGFSVHPWLHAISGFVGAGLVFAGVTDTCAMGMLIARMPWNQRSGQPINTECVVK